MRQRTKNDLRCICRTQPLLAKYGIDNKGERYIWVRVYRQGRIFGEIVVQGQGSIVKLHCRECLRWHSVKFSSDAFPVLDETAPPVQES